MSIEITHTHASAGLGLMTPEATLKTATKLNNDFLRLEPRVRHTKFAKEFGSLYAGWKEDYDKLRGSYFERLTELGKVAKWQKLFNAFKAKADAAGIDTSVVPTRVAGQTFDVPIQEAKALLKRAEAISEQAKGTAGGLSGAMVFLGIAVAAGMGLWFMSRRGQGTAGMGFAGAEKAHERRVSQLVKHANEYMDRMDQKDPPRFKGIARTTQNYLLRAEQETEWTRRNKEVFTDEVGAAWERFNILRTQSFGKGKRGDWWPEDIRPPKK